MDESSEVPHELPDFYTARDVEPTIVEWLYENRIPRGMITIIGGKPDVGKGLFVNYLAAHVTKMGEKVIYSAIEDDPAKMTRPRLEAAGANLDLVYPQTFLLPEEFERLAYRIIEHNVKLLVIDPLSPHLTSGVSRFSDSIRKVTTPLANLMKYTDCACVIIEHGLKRVSPHADPLTAIGGVSSGLPAAARAAYLFGIDPADSDRRILACVKNNMRDKPPALAFELEVEEFDVVGDMPFLVPQGELEFDAIKLVATSTDKKNGKPGRKPEKRAAAAEWLSLRLAQKGGPFKAGDVIEDAKQHGLTTKTVRNAANDMGVIKNPPGGGRNCTWDLPPEVKKALQEAMDDDASA